MTALSKRLLNKHQRGFLCSCRVCLIQMKGFLLMGPTSGVLEAMLVLKGCWLGNRNPKGSP